MTRENSWPLVRAPAAGPAARGRCFAITKAFWKATAARDAHAKARVALWHVPARSPDLNQVEKFWGLLRKRFREMDLADLKAKRRPVQRTALKARVRSAVASARAKRVAKNYAFGLRKVCEEVRRKKGAATRG